MNRYSVERYEKTKAECAIHIERMMHAHARIQNLFPFTAKGLETLKPDHVSFMDQYIFRFAKLQDAMGERLLPYALILVGEDIKGKPFIDLLNRLEKLNMIPSAQKWLEWRELRNDISHEYPDSLDDRVNALNLLPTAAGVFRQIVEYVDAR